ASACHQPSPSSPTVNSMRGNPTIIPTAGRREEAMPREFDAIVIGTGQSGPSLARRMAGGGWEGAVRERGQPGGTGVNTGCIPTKTLVASAKVAAMARRAGEYGVVLNGPVRIDMRRVKERMRAVSGKSREAVARSLERNENITFIHGQGGFVGPDA